MEDNEIQVSKYSSGVSINLRLDQLWKDAHLHSRTSRYVAWNLDLDCVWSELARDLKEKADTKKNIKSYKEIKTEFDKFDERIVTTGKINDKEPEGFRKAEESAEKARSKHYKILREKQLFLARLENNLGKGTTFDNNDEDSID